jgi:hypothetical protein
LPTAFNTLLMHFSMVIGLILTAFFDLSRIAALGIVFCLIMDIAIHWGVIHYLRKDIEARTWVPATAILLDVLALGGFVWVKLHSDPLVIGVAVVAMLVIAVAELIFLKRSAGTRKSGQENSHEHH